MKQSVAQIVVCDGIVRRQLDRLLEIGDRLLFFADSFQGLAQIADGVLVVRLDRLVPFEIPWQRLCMLSWRAVPHPVCSVRSLVAA